MVGAFSRGRINPHVPIELFFGAAHRTLSHCCTLPSDTCCNEAMRRILLLAALAAADDHIHASHADIELARDFRVDKHHKIIVSNIGDEDLAFYYLGNEGNQGMEHPEPTWDMSETLCAVLGPDEEAGRFVRFRDSFVVRSADMKWRVRFHIIPSRFIEQPYGITFSNPMTEGEGVIQLKHHEDAPVVPFGPGGQSSRAIPHGHRLELRDDAGRPRVAVEVHLPDEDE